MKITNINAKIPNPAKFKQEKNTNVEFEHKRGNEMRRLDNISQMQQ